MNESPRTVFLVTGASRGLGAALAQALDASGASLFLVARSAIAAGFADAESISADLSDPRSASAVLSAFGDFLMRRAPDSITLVNNAGTVDPIRFAEHCDPEEVDAAIRLNLVSPMVLTAGFIRLLSGRECDKRVVNISSGAASSPYAGWSTYCAGKAGLDHFTRCVGLEQQRARYPTKVIALAPGIVDTDMQSRIRGAAGEDFPMIGKFIELKSSGAMPTASEAAARIVRFLDIARLEHGGVYDIRDFPG